MRTFDPEKFTKWINAKYDEFRKGDIRLKVVDFAKHLNGMRSQTVSYWLLGKLTERPSEEQCNNLISIYGYEAYEPLGMEPPLEAEVISLLPPDEAKSLLDALSEIRASGLNKGKENASPEDRKKIMDIFSKHGVKFSNFVN